MIRGGSFLFKFYFNNLLLQTMLSEELKKYLNSLKKRDVMPSDESLRRALLSVGWGEDEISESLVYMRTRQTVDTPQTTFSNIDKVPQVQRAGNPVGNVFASVPVEGNTEPAMNQGIDSGSLEVNKVLVESDAERLHDLARDKPPETTIGMANNNAKNISLKTGGVSIDKIKTPLHTEIRGVNKDQASELSDSKIKTGIVSRENPEYRGYSVFSPNDQKVSKESPDRFMKSIVTPVKSETVDVENRDRGLPPVVPKPPSSIVDKTVQNNNNFTAPRTYVPRVLKPLDENEPPALQSEISGMISPKIAASGRQNPVASLSQHHILDGQRDEFSRRIGKEVKQSNGGKFIPPPRFGGPGRVSSDQRLGKIMTIVIIVFVVLIGIVSAVGYAFITGIGPFSKASVIERSLQFNDDNGTSFLGI